MELFTFTFSLAEETDVCGPTGDYSVPTKKQRLSNLDASMPLIRPQHSKQDLEAQSSISRSLTPSARTPLNRPSKPLQPHNVSITKHHFYVFKEKCPSYFFIK